PLGRLQDHAVARRQGGGHLPDGHHEGIVPGRDRSYDADRLPADHAGVPAHVLAGGAAFERACGAGEEPQVIHAWWELFGEEKGARLADVCRLEVRHLLGVPENRVGQLEQHLAPLLGDGLEPVHISFAGGRHGALDIFLRTLWYLRDDIAGRRVDDLLRLAAGAIDPFAADEHLTALYCRCCHDALNLLSQHRLLTKASDSADPLRIRGRHIGEGIRRPFNPRYPIEGRVPGSHGIDQRRDSGGHDQRGDGHHEFAVRRVDLEFIGRRPLAVNQVDAESEEGNRRKGWHDAGKDQAFYA